MLAALSASAMNAASCGLVLWAEFVAFGAGVVFCSVTVGGLADTAEASADNALDVKQTSPIVTRTIAIN